MENRFLDLKCTWCGNDTFLWQKLLAGDDHPYRVTCADCGRLAGFGNDAQRQQMHDAGKQVDEVEQPPATLKDWF